MPDRRLHLAGRRSRHHVQPVLIGGDGWAPVYGGEAVRLDGAVVGRLRSAVYGYTVERTVGTTYLPAAVPKATRLDVDVFAERIGGLVATDVLVDAAGLRMRG